MCLTQIRGKLIAIRDTVVEDAKILQNWWSNGAIMIYEGYPDGFKENVSEVRHVIQDRSIYRGLFLVTTNHGDPIGECSFDHKTKSSCYISLKICESDYIHRGYGTDTLYTFANYLFKTYDFKNIRARVLMEHKNAQNLLLKTGFTALYVDENCWCDPTGKLRSFIELELTKERFDTFYVNYLKNIEITRL